MDARASVHSSPDAESNSPREQREPVFIPFDVANLFLLHQQTALVACIDVHASSADNAAVRDV